jgi:hypothetical protein
MKFKLIVLIVVVIAVSGCAPSLLFTEQQFYGVFSDSLIPQKWHGEWEDNTYITRDSFSIDGLDYKVIKSKMNFGLDSAKDNDKLIFQDNWCYLCRYVELDSSAELFGYQILVANIDNLGNIKCWEMSYDYFLKNRLVSRIPTWKFINTDITNDGYYKKIVPTIVYAEVSSFEGINKFEFNRLIKKSAIITNGTPYFCNKTYDFDFFKNVASSRKPDIILTKDKKKIKRKRNKNEIRYAKIGEKNLTKKYMKHIIE